MYLSHFGLSQSPFGITPNPDFFFTGNKRGDILEALIYAITHGEGIIKVTGEVGSGKTMLCRMLEAMLPSNVVVIYLINPTLNPKEVVYALASELGIDTNEKRVDQVIRLLQTDLITKHVTNRQVVLLVEEAQAMPLATLEEIRLYSNLETAHHKLLQIVLFGQPELNESLALPRMRQLKERITHSFDVPPLTLAVIPEFLMFRMQAAGYHGPDIFSKSAIKLLATVSEGIVRRICILADKSLLAAFANNTHTITAKHIKAAIRDSEFSDAVARSQRRKLTIILILLISIASIAAGAWNFFGPSILNSVLAIRSVKPAVKTSVLPTPVTVAALVSPVTTTTLTPPIVTPAAAPENPAPIAVLQKQASEAIEKTSAPLLAVASQALPVPTPTSGFLRQRLLASKNWLDNEEAAHFSIQITLMVGDKLPLIEQFLNKTQSEIGTEKLYVYPSRAGTTPRYGVLYGSFSTRAEANATLSTLAKQWGYRPQLRTISGIREEIRRTNSDDLWTQ